MLCCCLSLGLKNPGDSEHLLLPVLSSSTSPWRDQAMLGKGQENQGPDWLLLDHLDGEAVFTQRPTQFSGRQSAGAHFQEAVSTTLRSDRLQLEGASWAASQLTLKKHPAWKEGDHDSGTVRACTLPACGLSLAVNLILPSGHASHSPV